MKKRHFLKAQYLTLNKRSHRPCHNCLHCYLCADVITGRIGIGASSLGDSLKQYLIRAIKLHVCLNLF